MAMTQKQKLLSTLAVVASLAAVAASYAWFDVYQKNAAEQKEKEAQNVLFTFDKNQVKKVVLTAKGVETTLERDSASARDGGITVNRDWKITSPIQAPAEELTVGAILDKLSGLKRQRAIASPSELGEYGLASPRIKIVLTLPDGKPAELDIGDDNSYDGTLFAKTGDSGDVDVLEAALKLPLDKSLFDLREKRVLGVFEFSNSSIGHLDVVTPKLTYSLARTSSSDWKIVSPAEDKADAAKCQQLDATLRNLKATRFVTEQAVEEDLHKYGLDHPSFTVNLTLGPELPQRTLVLADVKEGPTEHIYAKRASESWIAEVPASIVKDLDLSVADLRDKTVLSFVPNDVVSLLFSVGSNLSFGADRHRAPVDAGFGEDGWTMSAPATGDAKKWKCSAALSMLGSLKGTSIVLESANEAQLLTYGLLHPERTVTLLGAGGKALAKLLIGKTTSDKKTYVKSEDSPRVFQIETYRVGGLPQSVTDLEEQQAVKDGGTVAAKH